MWNSLRTVFIIIALVVIGLMAINFLTNIVPILLTAAAAFVLGRLSVNYDLVGILRGLMNRQKPAPKATTVIDGTASKPTASKPAQAESKPVDAALNERKNRLQEAEAPKGDQLLDTDFQVKTPEQIEAEARAREQELTQKAATPSPDAVAAALEERKKRLLGGQ
jgi:hypothetical protein